MRELPADCGINIFRREPLRVKPGQQMIRVTDGLSDTCRDSQPVFGWEPKTGRFTLRVLLLEEDQTWRCQFGVYSCRKCSKMGLWESQLRICLRLHRVSRLI